MQSQDDGRATFGAINIGDSFNVLGISTEAVVRFQLEVGRRKRPALKRGRQLRFVLRF